jgi:hypothetical protein
MAEAGTMRAILMIVMAVVALAMAQQVGLAHPGPLDPDGCHYDDAGNYHCH